MIENMPKSKDFFRAITGKGEIALKWTTEGVQIALLDYVDFLHTSGSLNKKEKQERIKALGDRRPDLLVFNATGEENFDDPKEIVDFQVAFMECLKQKDRDIFIALVWKDKEEKSVYYIDLKEKGESYKNLLSPEKENKIWVPGS